MIKYFVIKLTHLSPIEHGWGNGYVCVPKEHNMYGKRYDEVPVVVHGGLTFGCKSENFTGNDIPEECKENHWVFGFDTAHYGDNQMNCPYEYVCNETMSLANQLEEL